MRECRYDPDVAALAGKMTKAQRGALADAALLLDFFAGEGAGMEQDGETLWTDDVVHRLVDAFGMDPSAEFGLAVRAHLLSDKEG